MTKASIPPYHELEGRLITLRTPQPADYARLMDILNDRQTMATLFQYFHTEYWTDEMVQQRFERFQLQQNEGKTLSYAVFLKSTNEIVGSCGFKEIDLETRKAQFGLIVHRSVWGTGVAQECHRLAIDYAFNKIGLLSVEFFTDENNTRMKGFFEKVGIPCIERTKESLLRYEIDAEDWGEVRKRL